MRTLLTFLALSISMSFMVSAQQKVDADEIIEQINNNQNVNYKNVIIEGTIDFTHIDNMRLVNRKGDQSNYESKVEAEIYFENCIFLDDVIAYIYYEETKSRYIAHFLENVKFEGCIFESKSEFKYCEFRRQAVFTGSVFREEANFKYAEFKEKNDFGKCVFSQESNFKYAEFSSAALFRLAAFEEEANFKYVDFPERVDFNNSRFKGEANFKYAKFKSGVDFGNATFNGEANFKYTGFKEPTNIENAQFNGEVDLKYAKVGKTAFVKYLLQSNQQPATSNQQPATSNQ